MKQENAVLTAMAIYWVKIMLHVKTLTRNAPELPLVQALNQRAFPENERRALEPLLDDPTGRAQVLAFCDGAVFCGFACLLTDGDITHILYFAIEEPLRGRGYGAQALAALRARLPGQRILADVEAENPAAKNSLQRRRRRAFYLKNGYQPSSVRYDWRRESYEILVSGGDITRREFSAFWRNVCAYNPRFSDY